MDFARPMSQKARATGFTLIEMLVALFIVAIALAAAAQASKILTANAQRQSDALLAQLCAESELIRIRLVNQIPPQGERAFKCVQAGQQLNGLASAYNTPNPNFRRVEIRISKMAGEGAVPLFFVATVVGQK